MEFENKNAKVNNLKKFSDEQLASFESKLQACALLQRRSMDQIFDEFMHFLKSRQKTIEYYPSAAVNAIIETLTELPQDKDWVKNSHIRKKLNVKLQALNIKPYSGKRVSNLLTAIGFYKKAGTGPIASVFVDRSLLRHISDKRNSQTERILVSQQGGELR